MCNNCTHESVCGKCKATGGQVGKCEYFAQERRGAWIEETPFCCSCSICGHTRGGLAYEDGQNYCPNCGARMDGEQC